LKDWTVSCEWLDENSFCFDLKGRNRQVEHPSVWRDLLAQESEEEKRNEGNGQIGAGVGSSPYPYALGDGRVAPRGVLVLALPARAGWVAATGGTETYYEQNGVYYHAHIFTDAGAGTFTVTQGGEVEYLVVGGGGGGGGGAYHENNGGGGGAGGFQTAVTSVVASTYAIVVGAGGAGGTETARALTGACPPSIRSSLMAAAQAEEATWPTVIPRRMATAAAARQSATTGRSATGLRRADTTAGRGVTRAHLLGKRAAAAAPVRPVTRAGWDGADMALSVRSAG
jgi:hypothetical protein